VYTDGVSSGKLAYACIIIIRYVLCGLDPFHLYNIILYNKIWRIIGIGTDTYIIYYRVVNVIFQFFRGKPNEKTGKCLPVYTNIYMFIIFYIPSQTIYTPHQLVVDWNSYFCSVATSYNRTVPPKHYIIGIIYNNIRIP